MQTQQKRNLLTYPLGTIGRDMIYQLYDNFFLTYALLSRTLTSAQLGVIATLAIVMRVFDAVNDLYMGNIIERTRSRFGKFKPWMLAGILTTGAVICFSFHNHFEGTAFVLFYGISSLLYSITYTMHDIPYWAMLSALGSERDYRNTITARVTLCAGIGGTLATILIPLLTSGTYQLANSAAEAYGRIALFCTAAGLAFMFITLIGTRENRTEGNNAPRLGLKTICRTILRNDQLRTVALCLLLQQIGNSFALGGVGSFYIYFCFGYEGGLYSLFNLIGMLPTAFLMLLFPLLSRKLRRKTLLRYMVLIACIGYSVMLLGGVLQSFALLCIGYAAACLGQYCFYLLLMISLLNTVEYNEYRFGTRDEAIIAAVRPFMVKIGSALIIGMTSLCYILFRVNHRTAQIAELENQAGMGLISESQKAAQIAGVIHGVKPIQSAGLLIVMTLLPCILMLVSYCIYCKKYKLDEEEYDRICAALDHK